MSAAGPLALSLDVSAVPARPGGAGRYTIALARGLAAHPDVTLTLVAAAQRRGSLGSDGRAAPPARGPDVASRPPRLRTSGAAGVAPLRRGDRAPRAALHDAGAVTRTLRGHHPRLHLLRPSRMARAYQGRVLPACHPPGRPARGGARLREPGDGRAIGRELSRARTRGRGAARRGPRPVLARRAEPGRRRRRAARGRRARRPAVRRVRRHPRAAQGCRHVGRRVRRARRPPGPT